MKIKFLVSALILFLIITSFFTFNYINKKKQKILNLENQIVDLKIEKGNVEDKIGFIPFKYLENFKLEIFDNSLLLSKYKTNLLNFTKGFNGKGSSYLEFFNNQLYLVSANGLVAKTNLESFDSDEFNMQVVKTNLNEFLNQKKMFTQLAYGVKDIMIENDKIYISYTDEIKNDCFNISLLEGKILNDKINFKYFFKPSSCIKKDIERNFSLHQSGGRIVNLDNDNLLLSIGEFRSRLLAQNAKSINGKIIKINKKNKNIKIVSMGHRNPQGLFLDKDTSYIYTSEHGPKGGDEINIIKNKEIILNSGWPISSYGEHYERPGEDNSTLYKSAPLHKSHANYGFIEPEKNFTPSIGISELILLNFIKQKTLIVSSMGKDISEGDMSLHIYKVHDGSLENHKVIPINERVRDMIYIEKKNMVFLFLESSTSIGVIKL